MKTAIAIVMTLAAATLFGCQSPQGGGISSDTGFRIGVPTFDITIKQGDSKTVDLSLTRGDHFKRDVKLDITTTKGIIADPTGFLVKASEKSDLHLRIAAPKDAALGDYSVYVKGTPETGEATSIEFKVKVVSP